MNSYDPASEGLEVVDSIEYSDQNYCFDTRVVWRQLSTGRLLTARDSGCSCPSPFENYNVEDLDSVNEDCIAMLEAEVNSGNEDSYKTNHSSKDERVTFIDNVKWAYKAFLIGEEGPQEGDGATL